MFLLSLIVYHFYLMFINSTTREKLKRLFPLPYGNVNDLSIHNTKSIWDNLFQILLLRRIPPDRVFVNNNVHINHSDKCSINEVNESQEFNKKYDDEEKQKFKSNYNIYYKEEDYLKDDIQIKNNNSNINCSYIDNSNINMLNKNSNIIPNINQDNKNIRSKNDNFSKTHFNSYNNTANTKLQQETSEFCRAKKDSLSSYSYNNNYKYNNSTDNNYTLNGRKTSKTNEDRDNNLFPSSNNNCKNLIELDSNKVFISDISSNNNRKNHMNSDKSNLNNKIYTKTTNNTNNTYNTNIDKKTNDIIEIRTHSDISYHSNNKVNNDYINIFNNSIYDIPGVVPLKKIKPMSYNSYDNKNNEEEDNEDILDNRKMSYSIKSRNLYHRNNKSSNNNNRHINSESMNPGFDVNSNNPYSHPLYHKGSSNNNSNYLNYNSTNNNHARKSSVFSEISIKEDSQINIKEKLPINQVKSNFYNYNNNY